MKYETKDMISMHYESILDVELNPQNLSTENTNAVKRHLGSDHLKGYRTNAESWYGVGCKNGKDVYNSALLGNDKLLKLLNEKLRKLENISASKDTPAVVKKAQRRKFKTSSGDELDIHQVYQGNSHTAWTTTRKEIVDKVHNLVTLFISTGASCGTNANDTIYTALVALKVSNDLLAAGKSVKIITGCGAGEIFKNKQKTKHTISYVIKQYNETLAVNRLVAMCHCGFNRVMGFIAFHSTNEELVTGLGFPVDVSANYVPIPIQQEIEKGHTRCIYINSTHSMDGAINEIKRVKMQLEMKD